MLNELILHILNNPGSTVMQGGDELDSIYYKVESVNIILYAHVKGSCDCALLLVSAHMNIFVFALIGQLMNEGRITVVGKKYGLILSKRTS